MQLHTQYLVNQNDKLFISEEIAIMNVIFVSKKLIVGNLELSGTSLKFIIEMFAFKDFFCQLLHEKKTAKFSY